MTITDIKNAVNQVAPAYPVFSIDLFGSYANDENTEKSDIDFLVYFDEKFASLFDMSGLKLDIQERLNTQVEMLLEKSYIGYTGHLQKVDYAHQGSSSDQKFAIRSLQIPPRDGHPCPWLCAWHYQPALGTFTR